MNKRILPAALALAAALATGVSAQAGPARAPSLPPGWWHAQINVVIRHQPHTLIYDRGRVQSLTPTSLTLKERDGSSVTITVSSSTVVRVDGQPASFADVKRFDIATTISIDGGAAANVTARVTPAALAAMARQRSQTTTTTTTQTFRR